MDTLAPPPVLPLPTTLWQPERSREIAPDRTNSTEYREPSHLIQQDFKPLVPKEQRSNSPSST
eukprot:5441557-Pleurochrysis_carterae.AAC.1